MQLYLLRHGVSEARDHSRYPNDSRRPLTDEGIRKMNQAAKGMRALDLKFDVILTSPYTRTRQTAEIVANEFKVQRLLEDTPHLEPGGDPRALIKDLLAREASVHSILLVGHEPNLSELVSMLVVGSEVLSITMKKGSLCKLAVSGLKYGRCATLEFLLSPGQLRQMG
jgi:phosphohistidine phosphatase